MKDLRSLLADLSASWLKRRKAQAPQSPNPKTGNPQTVSPNTEKTVKAAPRAAEHPTRQRPAHKPKRLSSRDVASNM